MNSDSIVLGTHRPDLLHDETIADLFRASVKNHAAKAAIVFDGKAITYTELDRWSDAVAADLASRGIGRGNSVGFWWPRGMELHVAILGTIKAGAAYVPLDREMPAERVEVVVL